MYDIDIQKLLFENEKFKDKTYFITHHDITQKENFSLSRFGSIINIGMEGFSEEINQNSSLFEKEESDYYFQSLTKYNISNNDTSTSTSTSISDRDVDKMLLTGEINQKLIDLGVVYDHKKPFLIKRDQLDKVLDLIKNKENVIVLGELGNGKSIFLKELKPYLSINSIEVYDISDLDGDYNADLDELSRSKIECVVILDGYEAYLDFLEHFSSTLPENISLVLSARSYEFDKSRKHLQDFKQSFNHIVKIHVLWAWSQFNGSAS